MPSGMAGLSFVADLALVQVVFFVLIIFLERAWRWHVFYVSEFWFSLIFLEISQPGSASSMKDVVAHIGVLMGLCILHGLAQGFVCKAIWGVSEPNKPTKGR